MHAVVEEEVDFADLCEKAAEPPAARASNERPARAGVLRDGHGNVGVKVPFEQGRNVDAVEVAGPTTLQCLENDTGCDPAGHPGLENAARSSMQADAPCSARESRICIIPSTECSAADGKALPRERASDVRPQFREGVRLVARPRNDEQLVEPSLPVLIEHVARLRCPPLSPLRDPLEDPLLCFERIFHHRAARKRPVPESGRQTTREQKRPFYDRSAERPAQTR